jgi:Peptidase S46
VYTEMKSAAPLELNLDQLRSAVRAFSAGFFIVDAAMERTKPNLERETAFTDRNFPESVQKLKTAMSDFHAPTDIIMLDGTLNRLQKIETAKAILPLANLIRDPAKIETKADQLINQTRLGEVEFIEECLQKNADELKQAQDPLLQLAIQLYPTYLEMRNRDKAREGKLGQLYGALVDVKQQFLATQFIPDANGTLRLTSGRVRAYSPEDAIVKTPISTLKGVIEKTTGVEPFITPKAVLDKYQAGEFGSFRNAQLNDVPVAILYDTDTTGGNSGSPVFNKRGELVGVNFDRCFEATINDFAWNTNYSRSIGVDIRYVLWITGIVYGANHLLSEMGVK